MRRPLPYVAAAVIGVAIGCYSDRLPPPTYRYVCQTNDDCNCTADTDGDQIDPDCHDHHTGSEWGEVCISGLCQFPCTLANSSIRCAQDPAKPITGSFATCFDQVCSSTCRIGKNDCYGPQKCLRIPGALSSLVGGGGGGGGNPLGGGGSSTEAIGLCGVACQSSADCNGGTACIPYGYCSNECDKHGDCTNASACLSASDCGMNGACGIDSGYCLDSCASDDDCYKGFACVGDMCVPVETCKTDDDCAAGGTCFRYGFCASECIDNDCSEASACTQDTDCKMGTCALDSGYCLGACETAADCYHGFGCVANVCVPIQSGTTGTSTSTSTSTDTSTSTGSDSGTGTGTGTTGMGAETEVPWIR